MRLVDISGMYVNYGRGCGKMAMINALRDLLLDLPVVECETCRYYTTQDCLHEDIRSNPDALVCRDWNMEESNGRTD